MNLTPEEAYRISDTIYIKGLEIVTQKRKKCTNPDLIQEEKIMVVDIATATVATIIEYLNFDKDEVLSMLRAGREINPLVPFSDDYKIGGK